jgi:hypothetical protein
MRQRHGDRAALGQREAVEPVQQALERAQVALEARQQIVHDLVREHQAARVGLTAQHGAGGGFVQRLQLEHRAPAEAGAQVLAQRQVDGRQAGRGCHLRAVGGGLDEEGEGGVLARLVQVLGIVDHDQRPGLVELPGQRTAGMEPGHLAALPPHPRRPGGQQVRLAGAGAAVQKHRRAGLAPLRERVQHLGVRPGDEVVEAGFRAETDGQGDLLHPRYSSLCR